MKASRRRETLATTANTQNTQRLRRQVAQLEAELFALRNATDGATGGATVVTPGGSSGSGTGSSGSSATRPSRTHQVSRDLRSAADNAEQNLRQLLTGVENLRQIAASLEQSTVQSTATPRSPDLYPEFN
ncbi:GL18114 [Drosophila persimilis]|uniref:GL18114 n=1 Tax=Drosophila persimilis TaxID=7234 RepID=B4HC13_DROPE|nr:GL18114 [Drosophila persimilis]